MTATKPVSQEASRSPVVLVVDDEALVRLDIADTLRDIGFQVLEAASADEARIVLTAVPVVDVLLSDINMKTRGDGIALALWVATRFPDMPVLLASGEAGARRAAALACGNVRHFLKKPFDQSELERVVRSVTPPTRDVTSKSD